MKNDGDSPRDMVAATLLPHLPRRKIDTIDRLAYQLGYSVFYTIGGGAGVSVRATDEDMYDFPSLGQVEKFLRRERRKREKRKYGVRVVKVNITEVEDETKG